MGLSSALLVLTWLLSASAAMTSTVSLPSFKTVQVSLPFTVKIAPARGYSFAMSADQQVIDATNSSVSNSVLYLGTHGSFLSQQPISATVFMPADSLQQVSVRSPNKLVAVDTGFSVRAFSAKASGTSTLYARNLVAHQVSVTSTGTSSAVLSGSLGAMSLKGSGVSKFYLQGQADSLALELSGVSNAESAINSGNLQITGKVAFPGRVSYTHGICSLSQGGSKFGSSSLVSNILGSSCKRVSSVNIPTPDLTFTCGINVTESSSSSNGNNGRDGSKASGEDGSCNAAFGGAGGSGGDSYNVVIGGAGGNGGDYDSSAGNDGSNMYNIGTGGITIQPLACQSSAASNIF